MADVEANEAVPDPEVVGSRPATAKSQASRPASSKSTKSTSSRPASSLSQKSNRPASSVSQRSNRPGSSKSQVSRPVTASSTASSSSRGSLPGDGEFEDDTKDLLQDEEPVKAGCWAWFMQCVSGMWSTRDMHGMDNREVFVRTTVRELIVYCIFLVVLCLLSFGPTMGSTMFYYTSVMKNQFSGYASVSNVDKFWEYMETSFVDGLYWEYGFSTDDTKNYLCSGQDGNTGPCPLAPSDRNILYENRLLGLPRLKQNKVKEGTCTIHETFQNAIKECYAAYSKSDEDKATFGNGYRLKTSEKAWKYTEAGDLGSSDAKGKLGTYSGGGFVQELHSLKNETLTIISELREGLWIGRGTRVVSIDFTVYNANINLFCIVKIQFEFTAMGGVMPSASFRTVKLLRYVDSFDYFILACEIIFILFLFYYIIEEGFEIVKLKHNYLSSIWNILDLITICISIIFIFLNFYTAYNVNGKLKLLLSNPDQFADFTSLGSWSKQNNNILAICVFFAWIKLFQYISFNRTMTQLTSTLTRSANDVLGFSLMFFIVFFAFAQLGHVLFGTQVGDFSSFDNSIFTLLRTILGDFDFAQIQRANRWLGPIFFISYVQFVFFVLLNMFLAIINDTYSEVKVEITAGGSQNEVGDYFHRGYSNALGKMGLTMESIDIANAWKNNSNDGPVNYDEMRQNLKKCNFSDMEIEMFFSRYDVGGKFQYDPSKPEEMDYDWSEEEDPDNPAAPEEMQRKKSIGGRRKSRGPSAASRSGTARSRVGGEEFGILGRRVDRLESSINGIVTKIDAVLIKLSSMEKGKLRRKQIMSKVLTTINENPDVDDATKRQKMEELVRQEIQQWDESRPSTTESVREE